MELFDSDFNEVTAKWAINHFLRQGVTIKPLEIKREIQNRAKEWGVPVKKAAEAHKILLGYVMGYANSKIDEILKTEKVEE